MRRDRCAICRRSMIVYRYQEKAICSDCRIAGSADRFGALSHVCTWTPHARTLLRSCCGDYKRIDQPTPRTPRHKQPRKPAPYRYSRWTIEQSMLTVSVTMLFRLAWWLLRATACSLGYALEGLAIGLAILLTLVIPDTAWLRLAGKLPTESERERYRITGELPVRCSRSG